ncbi:family 2A encapsulin nanocompartment cargo protein cysteine desulfurase [Sporocytophaga myxococcoides]|uniref:family 2A encapsulin nanocompartment cargo protein cysteine desulfurase n=1 Tax=Sporocytophaga myxococcoides TaxID=153721 RepID=UPI0003FD93AC|nr:family 2A encapsulin nanocompartment cargo protein cysteine desulfurase [Sporocytophaga myxococcoides]
MSTTTNPNLFPDERSLEKLANEFFAALPGGIPNDFLQSLQAKDPLVPKETHFDLTNPQTSLPDPHFPEKTGIPKSVAGSGISPTAVDKTAPIDLQQSFNNSPDPYLSGNGLSPKSVAGSGISPSLSKQNPEALISNHAQTNNSPFNSSYPFQSGKLQDPKSALNFLPFEQEQPFETELKEALKGINLSLPKQQLPSDFSSISNSSYYFISVNEPLPFSKGSENVISPNKGITNLTSPPFDVNIVRQDFPILKERVNGKPLIWLDNAATTQKPQSVIDRIAHFYQHENSNIHRAAHELAARATDAYEAARQKVQFFLNASSPDEIIFVRGATEAINLVAKSWGEQNLNAGDEIVVSHLEHHANIVPWQQLAERKGLKLKVIPVDEDGQVILSEYAKLLGPKTKLVSFTQVSNALGTVTPAKQIVEMAHLAGAKVLVDGAQSVSHMKVDVQSLNCDWFVFSGHKVFGPTGIGVVYGKQALLNETQPWQGGGNMIMDVTFEHTTYHNAPARFEAGTGNIADAVGLGAAIDYVTRIGMDLIYQYEHYLLVYATRLLKEVPGLRLIGTAPDKASVLSFVLEGYRTEEVGKALNQEGIAVRSGHHCAQPILRRFGVEATVRPSLAFYNTCGEIDTLVATLHKLRSAKPISLR